MGVLNCTCVRLGITCEIGILCVKKEYGSYIVPRQFLTVGIGLTFQSK